MQGELGKHAQFDPGGVIIDDFFVFVRESIALPGFTVYLLTFAPLAIGQMVAGYSSKSAWALPSLVTFPAVSVWIEGLADKKTTLVWSGTLVLFMLTLLAIALAPSFEAYEAKRLPTTDSR